MTTTLQDISIGMNMRGMCCLCGRKSMRWAKWSHVESWHKNHTCINGAVNSRNGKKSTAFKVG